MPITFGSVGDIVSVSLLIKDLIKCLDESRGSPAEYQAVIRELWSLDHTLLEVEVLLRSCKQWVELNDIRETADRCAEQCRKCIENFLSKITKKYQSALQGGSTRHRVRDVPAKIRWHVSEKDDLAKFRAEIVAHWSSMNTLLITAGVKLSTLNDEGMRKRLKQSDLAYATSSATQTSLLTNLSTRLEETNTLIHAATSETKALGLRIDLDYFRNLGAQVLSLMHKIWRINSMTYNAIVSLQACIPAQLDRSWTQEPVMLEDALGRVTPFHVDFIESWEAFEAILEHRFRHLPGHRKIKQKEYALRSNLINKDVDSSIPFHHCFLPGQRYDMSMIFNAAHAQNSCPACLMGSDEASDARVMCKGCGLLYQRLIETTTETASIVQKPKVATTVPSLKRRRDEDTENDDEPKQFRRVRIKCRRVPRKRGSQDKAKQETLQSGEQMIRCVCGTQNGSLLVTSDDWLIQCGDCKFWQHRSCVGAANGNDPKGGFKCQQCSKTEEEDIITQMGRLERRQLNQQNKKKSDERDRYPGRPYSMIRSYQNLPLPTKETKHQPYRPGRGPSEYISSTTNRHSYLHQPYYLPPTLPPSRQIYLPPTFPTSRQIYLTYTTTSTDPVQAIPTVAPSPSVGGRGEKRPAPTPRTQAR